jgi:hypothetical protein
MKISLLENGLDSLQKGFNHLNTYEEMYILEKKGSERFLVLKDAVLAIHHGIEILFKDVLNRSNEILVFSEIDNKLKQAFAKKRQENFNSLFEADPTIRTVSFVEAIDRIQKICGYRIKESFRGKLNRLQGYRNQVMHSEVSINETELNSVFEGLVDDIDIFFSEAIGSEYYTVTGYSALKEYYQNYIDKIDKSKGGVKKIAIEKFLEAFDRCSISMGQREVKKISDINIATNLLDTLYKSRLKFGTDLYNLYCSGNVSSFKRIDKERFSMYAKDNGSEYIFKFKSLLIFMPSAMSKLSPILFFESDNDSVEPSNEKFVELDERTNRESISGVYFYDKKHIEWNGDKLNEFYMELNYNEFFIAPAYHRVEHFLSSGLFCFINVQMLEYGRNMKKIFDFNQNSSKEVEIFLRKVANAID